LCRFAREQGIWYNARGSAAGSIVAYVLEITLVEPLDHGLIFERFLNPGRVSMPDIDLDFQDDLRYRMLDYCVNKYGSDKVAQIITFGTLGARAAIRDVGRVMDIPLPEVDRIAKTIPNIPGKPITITQALEEVAELRQVYQEAQNDPEKDYVRELVDTAAKMEGVVRNVGTHAAGVVIADKPLLEYLPLHRPTGNTEATPIKTVTQFEMGILETLGLLKVDFLGLITLTIMQRACELIEKRHGLKLDLNNIPLDDPATFELLGRGQTAGVFQVEGTGMKRYLMEMKPKNLANVVAMIALYRPGPLEFIPSYIRRMHGKEPVEYRHPAMKSIFEETFGIPVYQEQIMRAAVDLAGYSMSESDDLRKAIAKKQKDKLLKHQEKFVKGAAERGMPKATAEAIFTDWEEFARYGFNKAHAADYGVISVQTGYLKAHYPAEYMTALLSAVKNKTEDVALYIQDCRSLGIQVLPPDLNRSGSDFSIEEIEKDKRTTPAIRFGLAAIKNVGQGAVEVMLKSRAQGGTFKSLDDFCQRVDLRQVGKRTLECLIKVGALDALGPRAQMLEGLDQIVNASAVHFRAAEAGQLSLFGSGGGAGFTTVVLPKVKNEVSRREMLTWEKDLIGLYVSDHPLQPVIDDLQNLVTHYSGQLTEDDHEKLVVMAGVVTVIRHHQTKKGDPMGFVSVEDLQGHLELVIFPKNWKDVSKWLAVEQIVVIRGKVDAKGGTPKILVDSLNRDFKVTRSTDLSASLKTGAPRAPAAVQPTMLEPEWSPGWEDVPPPSPDDEPVSAPEPMTPAPVETSSPPLTSKAESASLSASPTLAVGGRAERVAEAQPQKPANGHALAGNGTGQVLREIAAAYSASPTLLVKTKLEAPRRVVVTLHTTGDKERDSRRMRRVHGLLTSYPGADRFEFNVHEHDERNYQLRFPNHTTGYCPALERQLTELLGEGTVEVHSL
jgi:DNA polymerase-3 subunit alpha